MSLGFGYTPARADDELARGTCALTVEKAALAEKAIDPILGDLPTVSPRLARIVRSGMLARKAIPSESAFDHLRKVISAAEDLTDEDVIREMNRTGKDPSNLSGGNSDLLILGRVRRRGPDLEVKITHVRRMKLDWSENGGPNSVMIQIFAAVLDGISANLKRASAAGKPVESVVIRAGSVANKTLENMFLSFGFVYDPTQLAKLEAREKHPILSRTKKITKWFDEKVLRTEPEINVGKRIDLVLPFKPGA
jgi:hypothetical protein